MNEAKFTKGPWNILLTAPSLQMGSCTLGKQIWSAGGMTRVCLTEQQNVGRQQEEANAHLIAAAPEMYEALELAKGYIRDGNSSMLQVMEEALAKARGES